MNAYVRKFMGNTHHRGGFFYEHICQKVYGETQQSTKIMLGWCVCAGDLQGFVPMVTGVGFGIPLCGVGALVVQGGETPATTTTHCCCTWAQGNRRGLALMHQGTTPLYRFARCNPILTQFFTILPCVHLNPNLYTSFLTLRIPAQQVYTPTRCRGTLLLFAVVVPAVLVCTPVYFLNHKGF